MIIRPARADEAGAVAALVERAYAPWVEVIGRRPAPMDDDYAALIAAGDVYVLEQDGAPAAICVLIAGPDHLLLDNVAVDPDWQGRGLGQRLIRFAEADAARRGFPELRLYTHERMVANIALYEALGFRETHRAVSGPFRRVYMTKDVG